MRRPPDNHRPWQLGLVLGLAAVLRLPRVFLRWDEVAIAYAAYTEPAVQAVERLSPGELLGAWVGLHPPLHAALMAILETTWSAPLGWLLLSATMSMLTVAVVARAGGLLAALVVATSPLQLADAAEVNNYPLAVLAMAVLCAAARGPWLLFVAAVGLACWSHVLGMCAAAVLTLWRLVWPVGQGERTRVAAGALLVALPVAAGALHLVGQSSTFSQPELDLGEWWTMVSEAWGLVGVGLGLLTGFGLVWARGEARVVWAGLAVAYMLALLLGAAAPHQRPYLGLLGPPAALVLAATVHQLRLRRGTAARTVWLVVAMACLGRGGVGLAAELESARAVVADLSVPRGIDDAWAASRPGDTLWLVAPALQADDDKSDRSPVLWRLRPWWTMPRASLVGLQHDPIDYLWGHPRRVQARTLHTSTELSPRHFDAVAKAVLADGGRLFVVLYDHAPATELAGRVARVMRPYAASHRVHPRSSGLGDDHVWQVDGLAGSRDARP